MGVVVVVVALAVGRLYNLFLLLALEHLGLLNHVENAQLMKIQTSRSNNYRRNFSRNQTMRMQESCWLLLLGFLATLPDRISGFPTLLCWFTLCLAMLSYEISLPLFTAN